MCTKNNNLLAIFVLVRWTMEKILALFRLFSRAAEVGELFLASRFPYRWKRSLRATATVALDAAGTFNGGF